MHRLPITSCMPERLGAGDGEVVGHELVSPGAEAAGCTRVWSGPMTHTIP